MTEVSAFKFAKKPKGEKKLHHAEIPMPAEKGMGITVIHHFHPTEGAAMMGMTHHPPEHHSFGPGPSESKRFMEHMHDHFGMEMPKGMGKPGTTDDEGLDEGQESTEPGEESAEEDGAGSEGEEDD